MQGRCRSSSLAGTVQPNAWQFLAPELAQLWSADSWVLRIDMGVAPLEDTHSSGITELEFLLARRRELGVQAKRSRRPLIALEDPFSEQSDVEESVESLELPAPAPSLLQADLQAGAVGPSHPSCRAWAQQSPAPPGPRLEAGSSQGC